MGGCQIVGSPVLICQHLVIFILLSTVSSSGDAVVLTLKISDDPNNVCLQDRLLYTCTVPNALSWTVGTTQIGSYIAGQASAVVGATRTNGALPGVVANLTEVNDITLTSTLTIPSAGSVANGSVILCEGLSGDSISTVLHHRAPLTAPSIPSVTFHSRQRFTITWNEPLLNMGETVDAYFVNISGPGDLCRDRSTLRRVTERSYTCSIQRGRVTPQEGEIYTITVAAANCGGTLRGPESAPALLQVPTAPSFTFRPDCPGLGFVDIVWQDNMITPPTTEVCVNCIGVNCMSECRPVSGNNPFRINNIVNGTNYTISLSLSSDFGQSEEGPPELYENNEERCVTTATPTTLIPTVTQPTPSLNFEAAILANNSVQCLLDGQPAANCSIHYGTDPTYRVLPNTDSAVTGGVITLSSTLTGDTTYYIVSTATGSLNMELRGSFTTCTTQDLMASNTLVQPQSSCGEPTGDDPLACYSGVTPGSTVMYRCANSSLVTLSGQSIRTCLSDSTWSGTTPSCVCTSDAAMAISIGAAVAISVILSSLVSFSAGALLAALMTYCCCVRRKKSSGEPHSTSSEAPHPVPVYDEVVAGKLELKENIAYGPLEMKQNPSYGPVGH